MGEKRKGRGKGSVMAVGGMDAPGDVPVTFRRNF